MLLVRSFVVCRHDFNGKKLVEKAREHDNILFVLFVDLNKVYNSVPRIALWNVLEKVSVPPTKVQGIRSFHDGMWAHHDGMWVHIIH